MKQKYIARVVYNVEEISDQIFSHFENEDFYNEKMQIIWNAITPMMQELEELENKIEEAIR